MIEMLGVLAIIGVLSAGGIMGYSTAMENYRTNKTIDDIKTLTANITGIFQPNKYSPTSELTRINEDKLCQIGALTDPYCKHKSRWNTSTYFYVSTGNNCISWGAIKGSEPCMYFHFSISDIPKSACVKFLTHDWSNFSPAYAITIQEHLVATGGSYVLKARVRHNSPIFSVAEAETACTKTTYDYIRIEGRFYFKGTPLP